VEPRTHRIADFYPLRPRPRWGYGAPPHPRIAAILEAGRPVYAGVLAEIARHRSVLDAIPRDASPERPDAPYWDNAWFSTLDAAALVGLILARRPARYIEIGSGHSTRFARFAVAAAGTATEIVSIDPRPHRDIDGISDRVIRTALEDCPPALFDGLAPDDIVFFDGTHRAFTNSDVTAFFLDVLPRLPAGVLVHVHDVFLPLDYPPEWSERLYSEQYVLGAMLLGRPPFRVLLPNHFVCHHPELGAEARRFLEGGSPIPFHYAGARPFPGVSFWLETTSAFSDPPAL
jgi:hypothetical protein